MGGVGKLNLPITLYRINAKTKKWPVRIISHFFDLVLANAQNIYRDIPRHTQNLRDTKKRFDFEKMFQSPS